MKKRINTETEVVHNELVNSLFESSPNQEFLRYFFFHDEKQINFEWIDSNSSKRRSPNTVDNRVF